MAVTGALSAGRTPLISVPLHDDDQVDPIAVKVARLRELFGSNASLARYLGVARSQPGRWIGSRERPNAVAVRRIKDLEYVWDRATDEMAPQDAARWLEAPNPFLAGATPLTALLDRGPAGVIGALDAYAADVYA
jgi:uncharacterized protein (DUF2384 family)